MVWNGQQISSTHWRAIVKYTIWVGGGPKINYWHQITCTNSQQVDMAIGIVCDLYSVSPPAHGSAWMVTLSLGKSKRDSPWIIRPLLDRSELLHFFSDTFSHWLFQQLSLKLYIYRWFLKMPQGTISLDRRVFF